MKRTIEELREYARKENAACSLLRAAGYECYGVERGGRFIVAVEKYREGEGSATHFPALKQYFDDFQAAAAELLNREKRADE